jgi:hypothetical protein
LEEGGEKATVARSGRPLVVESLATKGPFEEARRYKLELLYGDPEFVRTRAPFDPAAGCAGSPDFEAPGGPRGAADFPGTCARRYGQHSVSKRTSGSRSTWRKYERAIRATYAFPSDLAVNAFYDDEGDRPATLARDPCGARVELNPRHLQSAAAEHVLVEATAREIADRCVCRKPGFLLRASSPGHGGYSPSFFEGSLPETFGPATRFDPRPSRPGRQEGLTTANTNPERREGPKVVQYLPACCVDALPVPERYVERGREMLEEGVFLATSSR